jgi:hypothetical protein
MLLCPPSSKSVRVLIVHGIDFRVAGVGQDSVRQRCDAARLQMPPFLTCRPRKDCKSVIKENLGYIECFGQPCTVNQSSAFATGHNSRAVSAHR